MAEEGDFKEAPPSYSETAKGDGQADNTAPPTYQSLFGDMSGIARMKSQANQVRRSDEGSQRAKGCFNLLCLCFGSVFCTCFLVVLAAWPIALIVVGAIDLHNCNLDYRIPIWMIVYGVFSLLLTITSIFKHCCRKKKEDRDDDDVHKGKSCLNCIDFMIYIFVIVWLFIGSSWVLGRYTGWRDGPGSCFNAPDSPLCCEPRAYLFAFGTILTVYAISILCFLFCCLVILCGCCIVLLSDNDED